MKQFGPYQLIRRLGAGATAEVFLAAGPNPLGLDLLMALKVILPHLAEDDGLRATTLKEARVSALLRHPNVVSIYEVGEVGGRPFLAMEFIPGWSVSALEKKLRPNSERLPFGEACTVVREAAMGLHYAHEVTDERGHPLGLIHRDVSPQNIIIAQDGRVKVVDFGMAKATNAQATQTGGIKGKLPYMPPEQLRSEGMDRRVDVFALGAVLWELCCGRLLYPGVNEAEIIRQVLSEPQARAEDFAPKLPRPLLALLARTVDRDVAKRTPTALALAQALEPFVPEDAAERLARRVREHFEPLPLTASEALGLPPTPEGSSRRIPRSRMSAPVRPRVQSRLDLERAAEPEPEELDEEPQAPPAEEDPASDVTLPPLRRGGRWVYALFGVAVLGVAVVFYASARGLLPAALNLTGPEPDPQAQLGDEGTPEAPKTDDRPRATGKSPKKTALVAAKGTLVVQSDVPAFVRENGKELGMTPLTMSVTAGHHRLSVQTADRRDERMVDVTVPPGEEIVRRVDMQAP